MARRFAFAAMAVLDGGIVLACEIDEALIHFARSLARSQNFRFVALLASTDTFLNFSKCFTELCKFYYHSM